MVKECRYGRSTCPITHATWSCEAPSRPVLPCSTHSATTTVACGKKSTGNCKRLPPPRTSSLHRCCKHRHMFHAEFTGRTPTDVAATSLGVKRDSGGFYDIRHSGGLGTRVSKSKSKSKSKYLLKAYNKRIRTVQCGYMQYGINTKT